MASDTHITVQTVVNAPIDRVWKLWTDPAHIVEWNAASEDWHTPHARNDVRVGGSFLSRMEARDGSVGFDFTGIYDEVEHERLLAYTMDDGRSVRVTFTDEGASTRVTETFEAEQSNSVDMQREGWKAILDNFKRYAENL